MNEALLLFVGGFLILGSTNVPEKTIANQDTTNRESHQHGKHVEAVEMNNGAKWVVNEEMKPIVSKNERFVNT